MANDEDGWVTVDPKTGEPLSGLPRITVTPAPSAPKDDDGWVTVPPKGATPPPAAPDPNARGDPTTIALRAFNQAGMGIPNRFVAAKQALTGEAPSYSEALENLNKRQAQVRQEYPWTTGGTDAAATTGSYLLGRGVLAPAAAATSLGERAAAGAVEGGLLGGAHGAGQTYSGNPSDYAKNSGMGAVFGGGFGAAGPYVGRALGGAYDAIVNRFKGQPTQLERAAAADAPGLREVATTPGAMLPDAGPSVKGVAQGAVLGTGGTGRTALVDNLTQRDAGTAQRIVNDVNNIYGPAPIPSRVEAGVRERMGQMGPAYEAVLNNARAIDNGPLALQLEGQIGNERGPAQAALRHVRSMLDIPTNPGVLDPHPRALQATREAVRGMRDDPNADPNTRRVLGDVYNQLTREIQTKVPGIRALDSQYAELGAQERASQTSSQGARVFQTDRENVARPIEIADEMVGRSVPDATTPSGTTIVSASTPKGVNVGPSAEAFRLRQSTRGELDRIVGTNRNDLAALERVLGQPQDWNAQKLALTFGQDRADALMNVLSRERNFRQTYQDVVQGSQTAQRTAAKESLEPNQGKIPVSTTLTGLGLRGAQGAIDFVRRSASDRARDRIAQTLATTDPVQINQLVNQLLAQPGQRDARRDMVQRLIERGAGAAANTYEPRQKANR